MTKFKVGEYYSEYGVSPFNQTKKVIIATKRAKNILYFTLMQKTSDGDIIVSENLKTKIRVKYGIEHFIWGESLMAPMFAASRTCDRAIQEWIELHSEVARKYKKLDDKPGCLAPLFHENWGWLFPA